MAALQGRSAYGKWSCIGVCRYLVEAPPNICTPTHLADAAQRIAEGAPDVMKVQILEEEDCRKLGMGCFLGVAACSQEPPKFVHLTYTPAGVLPPIAL
jgi:leucyl aminopeptidase